jgi:short-subunit dehydrogenase
MNYFLNKRIWITGGSSGIGACFAEELHALGAHITLIARRESRLATLCNKFNRLRQESACYIVCDLSNQTSTSFQELCHQASSTPIDILINNAGFGTFGEFLNLPAEQELAQVGVNISAYLSLTHAALQGMKERRSGHILAVSSIAALAPLPLCATYAATKAFIHSHALSLRHELAPYNIKVTVLCPGPTDSEFSTVANIPGTITGLPSDSTIMVVRSALRAIENNRARVIPGFLSSMLACGSLLLPHAVSARICGAMSGWAVRRRSLVGRKNSK